MVCGFTLVVASVLVSPSEPIPKGEAESAEVQWAIGVVEDMFAAAFAQRADQVESLATSELRAAFPRDRDARFGTTVIYETRDAFSVQFRSFMLKEGKLAPSKNEVRFTGTLHGTRTREGKEEEVKRTFTIRVVKHERTGLWRIDYFRVQRED